MFGVLEPDSDLIIENKEFSFPSSSIGNAYMNSYNYKTKGIE